MPACIVNEPAQENISISEEKRFGKIVNQRIGIAVLCVYNRYFGINIGACFG
jgi:hypothetical protein